MRVLSALSLLLTLLPSFALAKDASKKKDPRSISVLGNHRASWDGDAPIYYWSNLGREFEENELGWVFSQWSEHTPLHFVHEADREACEASRRCIKFVRQTRTARCASTIGRQYFTDDRVRKDSPEYRSAGAIVYVNPSFYCKGGRVAGRWRHGAMLHEVGHALGLFHEHQRFDRDLHIAVHPCRVKEGGRFDIVPTSRMYRIDRKDKRKVWMPMATAWGPYNPRSVMHYWRKHKTNNGLVTLGGAPSLFAFHMLKLQGSDVANAMAANFPKRAFLIARTSFRSSRRDPVDIGGPGLWKTRHAVAKKTGKGMTTKAMIIPAGVELSVGHAKPEHRYVPGMYQVDLDKQAEFRFTPALTLYSIPRYNQFLASLGPGLHDLGELGLAGGLAPGSLVVGSGLSLRACFDRGQDKFSCRRYSSRAVQYLPNRHKLRSLELQLAVTIWDDVNFHSRRDNAPRGVESFVPRQDGRRLKYRPRSRRKLPKQRNRSLYVPPGLAAKLCPTNTKKGCTFYSNQGVAKLPEAYFDRSIDLRVYPAATLFAGPHFDDQSEATTTLHEESPKQELGSKPPGSVIVGPGVTLHLCEDSKQERCCKFSGGNYGARFSDVATSCSLEPKTAFIAATPLPQ